MTGEARTALMEAYRPHLAPLENNLFAASFPLMKIYPAEYCVRAALRAEQITPDSLLVETSSGTMALGLAIVCKWYGLRLTIVSDYACDDVLRRRLEDLGANTEIVAGPAAGGGYQRARLDRLHEIQSGTKDCWWVNQYDNASNPASYGAFAAQLAESLGRVDCLVGPVGSGGSMCGTARSLRILFPDLQAIGVDTFGSVLFGQPDEPRKLRGLGNSIMPGNLDHTVFDEIHWVSAAEAFTATRRLHRTTTLFRGGTSGACWLVARHWARRHPDARAVCIFPDDGQRYTSTIYDDRYLQTQGLWLREIPPAPREVEHPADAEGSWSRMQWRRRSYQEAAGRPAASVGRPPGPRGSPWTAIDSENPA